MTRILTGGSTNYGNQFTEIELIPEKDLTLKYLC